MKQTNLPKALHAEDSMLQKKPIKTRYQITITKALLRAIGKIRLIIVILTITQIISLNFQITKKMQNMTTQIKT